MTDCRKLWHPPTVSPTVHWGIVAGKLGAVFPLERPFLIGIRGAALWATDTHETRSRAAYDDTFVLLPPDDPPEIFRGSTHAFQLFSKLSPDVNGDGVGDVATINPGRFILSFRMFDKAGCPVFELTMPNGDKNIPASRDVNHDGTADAGPYTANAILFHTGYDAPAGAAHSSSIACQTTSVGNLMTMKRAGRIIDYVMLDAVDVLALVPDVEEITAPSNTEGNVA